MQETVLIGNGTVLTSGPDSQVIHNGGVLLTGDTIEAVGPTEELKDRAGEFIDARGRLVMPGLVCAHHHLYSTLSCGIASAPSYNFVEVLQNLWWKLDRALDMEDVYYSALIPLARCIASGTTTIIDHHASPAAITGSLARIGDAVTEAGIRASLCYEVTDRNGLDGAQAGIDENAAWLKLCRDNDKLHGLVGIHAAMTVGQETLAGCVALAKEHGTGLHIHVAEDLADQEDSLKKYGKRVIQRLADAGGLGPNTLAVHCVHIDDDEVQLLKDTDTVVVHNAQSNMNNGVGCANVLELTKRGIRLCLGTDGMTSNMFEEARAAFFVRHHAELDPSVGFMETTGALLQTNPAVASSFFGRQLGVLEPGAAADVIIVDYAPFTPMNAGNAGGHLLFGAAAAKVDTTICGGKVLMRDAKLLTLDLDEIYRQARERSPRTWERFAAL
ncbi:MAG: putative aminohydrolase SsnA [Proteobacteria bacterium]|jgi:putative selenium metabolism protein SsnA|nr:putative aminohydrolase SsnA [Pseudomonadota bacterium]